MIITANDFINSGLPTSTDITTSEIDFAIKNIELYMVKSYLTDTIYNSIIETPQNYTQYIDGTTTIGGLKLAEYHLVFSYLLYDKIRLTRYSSVIKNDENSTDPAFSEVFELAQYHWNFGLHFLKEVCMGLNVLTDETYNDLIFSELI